MSQQPTDPKIKSDIQRPATGPVRASRRRQLFRRVLPHFDESLRGFIVRSCTANHVDHTFGVMRYLGQVHRNRFRPAEDWDVSTVDLAAMLRTTEEAVERLRYPPIGGRNRSFFGIPMHQDRIETRVRRFSPAFFSKATYHRAQWELKDLPFCNIGWDMLIDRCPCHNETGLVQGWVRTNTRIDACDRCGNPLAELPSRAVPEQMRDVLSLVASLVDTDLSVRHEATRKLPSKIMTADPANVFSVISRIARALNTEGPYLPSHHHDVSLEALHMAGLAILKWPDGLEAVNAQIERSSRSLRSLLADYASLGDADCKSAASKTPILSWADASDIHLAAKPASHLVNLSVETLDEIWTSGLVTKHYRRHGSRLVPAFERHEIIQVAKKWRARISADELATELGIDRHGVEQLAAMDLMPATGIHIPGTGPFFEHGAAKLLFDKLEIIAQKHTVDDAAINMAETMDFVGGRRKPWGPVIRQLLTENIPFRLSGARSNGLPAIEVAEHDAASLIKLSFERSNYPGAIFARRINQKDALACLNASVQRRHLLADLTATGTVPKFYEVNDVERLAARIITTAEIAKRLDMNCATASAYVKNGGLRGVGKGAFLRDDFEELISDRIRKIILRLKRVSF